MPIRKHCDGFRSLSRQSYVPGRLEIAGKFSSVTYDDDNDIHLSSYHCKKMPICAELIRYGGAKGPKFPFIRMKVECRSYS